MRDYIPNDEQEAAAQKANRVFSYDQLATIAAIEKACGDAGCEGDEHKCNE